MSNLSKFVVCGSGMMGAAIAQILASIDGAQVTILRSSNRGADPREKVRSNMKQLVEKGVVTPEYVDELVGKIDIAFEDEAVKDGELFIECVPEVMELKQDLFARLEKTVSEKAIFCTNTSVMSPTEISAKCEHKERICGTHFWNPAFLIPLVEVVKTEYTSDEVINTVMEVMTAAGKQPCLCKKDVPGFIANRMQHALWREAVAIVNDGIADAATVDLACKTSFGLRLPYLPPLVNSDMVGTQLTYNIHSYVLEHLADNHEPSPILQDMIDKGEFGFRAEPDENGIYHGFMDYTKDQINTINSGLNEYLIKMLYDK
ncbi:MAG: 3-hydroxyacyl-CoA dehydrogenase family protein [Lachnospiraceae bacterium]|nr:3-hydroxyacyl-CoA dehydrogenase family protein [Lachnospiraceae bacterium]